MTTLTESDVEQAALEWLADGRRPVPGCCPRRGASPTQAHASIAIAGKTARRTMDNFRRASVVDIPNIAKTPQTLVALIESLERLTAYVHYRALSRRLHNAA